MNFHQWDDEIVVYNSLSGDTHLLDAVAMQLLLKLRQSVSDTETLVRALAIPEMTVAQVEQILHALEAIALVEPA